MRDRVGIASFWRAYSFAEVFSTHQAMSTSIASGIRYDSLDMSKDRTAFVCCLEKLGLNSLPRADSGSLTFLLRQLSVVFSSRNPSQAFFSPSVGLVGLSFSD